MTKEQIEAQIKDFEAATEVIKDIRSMLGSVTLDGTLENAHKLIRAHGLLKNMMDINDVHKKKLQSLKKGLKRGESANYDTQEEPIPADSASPATEASGLI